MDIARRAEAAKSEAERTKILSESPRMLRGYMLAKASLVAVKLEARVLDEGGNPLVGAKVYYNTGGGLAGGASGSANTVTDADGRFVTAGQGSNLTIQAVVKEGYRIPVRAQGALFIENGGADFDSWAKFSHEHPKVYHAWRVPADMVVPKRLVKSNFDLSFTEGVNDRVHRVELLGGGAVISQAPADYQPIRDERVEFELTDLERTEGAPEKTKWTLRMTVGNGGGFASVPRENTMMATAPETGYDQTVRLTTADVGASDQQVIENFWYVNFADVHRYCRLRLELHPPRDPLDHGIFGVRGFAACNPLGQRYFFPYNGRADW
jgi:hypothetical protein